MNRELRAEIKAASIGVEFGIPPSRVMDEWTLEDLRLLEQLRILRAWQGTGKL